MTEDQVETKMILIWIMTIQVCFIIYLSVGMKFNEHMIFYCINWGIHFAVFVCLALLKWT